MLGSQLQIETNPPVKDGMRALSCLKLSVRLRRAQNSPFFQSHVDAETVRGAPRKQLWETGLGSAYHFRPRLRVESGGVFFGINLGPPRRLKVVKGILGKEDYGDRDFGFRLGPRRTT